MTLTTLLTDYYTPLRGIDARTVRLYKMTFKQFGTFIGHEPTTDDLEELVVAKFLAHRLKNRSMGTAAKDRSQLRAVWEFAARRGLTKDADGQVRWPSMRTIRVPERVPRAWLIEELQRLVEAAADEPGEIVGVPASKWWRAILLTAYWTGERVGALLQLRWEDIEGNSIIFRAEDRKGRLSDEYREVPPDCIAAIEAIRTRRGLVFDWDRCYTHIWGRLGRICKRAGLPNDRMSKFHRVRKTSASYYEAGGGSAQRLMGHRNKATTAKYLDPRIVKTQSASDVLPKVG